MNPFWQLTAFMGFGACLKMADESYQGIICFRTHQCFDTSESWVIVTPVMLIFALIFLYFFVMAVYNDWKK